MLIEGVLGGLQTLEQPCVRLPDGSSRASVHRFVTDLASGDRCDRSLRPVRPVCAAALHHAPLLAARSSAFVC